MMLLHTNKENRLSWKINSVIQSYMKLVFLKIIASKGETKVHWSLYSEIKEPALQMLVCLDSVQSLLQICLFPC